MILLKNLFYAFNGIELDQKFIPFNFFFQMITHNNRNDMFMFVFVLFIFGNGTE